MSFIRKQTGFTLLELAIVLLIVYTMAVVAVSKAHKKKTRTHQPKQTISSSWRGEI